MEKWRRVWREGLAPQLSRAGLCALQLALLKDDHRLVQGTVTLPPPLDFLRDQMVEGTCAVSFCGWRGEGLCSVGQIEAYFHRVCDAADVAFHEAAACRYFLNWFDDAPREEMRRELLAEVNLALRQGAAVAA
jgi:hypothetical protein